MPVEIIPKIVAVVLAAICAGTDFIWGKVFNKVVSRALIFSAAWLAFTGAWHAFGGSTSMQEFPVLGMWKAPQKVEKQAFQGNDGPGAWNSGAPVSVKPETEEEWERARQAQAAGGPDGATAVAGKPGTPAASGGAPAPAPSFWIYAAKMAINALTALVIGMLMWWFGMWAAGDAKLFAALVAILPLSSYANSYWPWFPAYVLIFNSFLALLGILVGELLIRFIKLLVKPSPEDGDVWKNALTWVRDHKLDIVRGFLGILFFMMLIKTLRMATQDFIGLFATIQDSTLMYVILFLIFQPLQKLMMKKWVLIPAVLFTAGFVAHAAIWPSGNHNVVTIVKMSGLMVGVVGFLITYQLYLNVFDYRPIRIWELRPQMLLSRKTTDTLKEDRDMLDHKMGPIGPDGLSRQQVETLRRWWIDRGKGGKIWISRTIPFAPALFIGTILTVILSGYIFRVTY